MGSPSVIRSVSEKPQRDVKNDIMTLFGKVNISKFYAEIVETIGMFWQFYRGSIYRLSVDNAYHPLSIKTDCL